MSKIDLQPINRKRISFWIRGTSPLIMHKWSDKAKKEMRDKQQLGKKTKERELKNPEDEARNATHYTRDGHYGISGMAFKNALVNAAHKDLGITKVLVRKAIFLVTSDPGRILPIESDPPTVREDFVRVGNGSADLRYRPEFNNWRCYIELEVDADLIQENDIINLVNRAGFGVGIHEWRPEKDGEYGRFEVDDTEVVSFG